MNKADGTPCASIDETIQRWQEHYLSALNFPAGPPSVELESESTMTRPSTDISTDEPTLDEVTSAIKKLRNGRAAGPDGIPPELLKCALNPVSSALHKLFLQVWRTGHVPAEWRDGVIISLYKGKGPKTACSSYRPITLLSVPGKVFAHLLLARIQPLLLMTRRPQQSGFTPGRSTIDAILALRLLSELHREFDRPLNVAFLDIKSAFDSVDRSALWKALRSKGMPDVLLNLIADLHQNTGACVCVDGKLSPRLKSTSGVRQGCVLAPALFCVAIDWILDHMTAKPAVNVGSHRFSDLVYADDTTLFCSPETDIETVLADFSQAAAPFGLKVSWPKTKLQNLGTGPPPAPVSIDGTMVEPTDSFTYLGSIQSSSGYCRPDLKRRISIASSAMFSLRGIWKDKRLPLALKIRIYQSLVLSVLLYAAETWTLLSADEKTLEAFHMRSLRLILGIRWYHRVTNADILLQTGLPPLLDSIRGRRLALLGHVARLDATTPANQILRCSVDLSSGIPPANTWRRKPGRPRKRWLDQLQQQSGSTPSSLWDQAITRGHGQVVTQRPSPATRS